MNEIPLFTCESCQMTVPLRHCQACVGSKNERITYLNNEVTTLKLELLAARQELENKNKSLDKSQFAASHNLKWCKELQQNYLRLKELYLKSQVKIKSLKVELQNIKDELDIAELAYNHLFISIKYPRLSKGNVRKVANTNE